MNDRFDLDKAIAQWRKSLSHRRTFGNEDLDEIESHVLDHIDTLINDGSTPHEAFVEAAARFGDEEDVEAEYRKTRWTTARSRGEIMRESVSELAMAVSYARIALRNLRRHKIYAAINIGGLALGVACCLLILVFVLYETSYDKHHPNADRTYRVTRAWFDENDEPVMELARISRPIAPALEQELPEVVRAVRLWEVGVSVAHDEKRFQENNVFFADSAYFELFGPGLLRGNPRTVLSEPNTVVITDDVAAKYFGDEDPIGQTVTIDDEVELVVTGVMHPQPPNSHVHPDFVASLVTTDTWFEGDEATHWGMYNNFLTYVMLADGADVSALQAKLPAFLRSHYTPENNTRDELRLQAITDIHLHSNLDSELEPNGNINTIYLFLAIAVFVLLIACFNFVNLATARASYRSREVGMRKVLGAAPGQILRQFLGEAIVFAFMSTVLATGIAALLLPQFGALADRDLHLAILDPVRIGVGLLAVILIVGFLAGGYPALVLSRFKPSEVLRGTAAGSWRSKLRSALVVSQFAISILLISGMGIVFRQVEFVQNKHLGFDKEHLVLLPATDAMRSDFESVRQQLLASPFVAAVTASRLTPSGSLVDRIGIRAEVDNEIVTASVALNPVDHDFIDTYQMSIAAGRSFSKALAGDSIGAYVINEAAVRHIGWASPQEAIGKRFDLEGNSLQQPGNVIGVIKDFHFESLREEISPLVLFIMPGRYRTVTVRLEAGDPAPGLAFLEQQWGQYRPTSPFVYSFVDENFGALYAAERRLGEMFGLFALVAITIACLGLFGLASFMTERRSKEIGIRKALGASATAIVGILTKEFLILVAIAFVLSLPVTYGVMNWWLSGFAYNVGFGVDMILAAGAAVAVIAFLTVSYQSLRSALANPVTALRNE